MKIEWNKVTSFSKIIALILFIALPFLGFCLGMKYGELKSITNATREYFINAKNNSLPIKTIVKPETSSTIERERICSNSDTLNLFPAEVSNLSTPALSNEFQWMQTLPTFGSFAINIQESGYGNIPVCGKEWVAYVQTNTIEEQNALDDKFGKYVGSKFISAGWKQETVNSMGHEIDGGAGDGPDGGFIGYLKATDNLIRAVVFSHNNKSMGQPDYNCPCIKEFRVFISDIIPIKEVVERR